MKISRFKRAHKTLTFFATNFGYREPYQILVDATFCQKALQVSSNYFNVTNLHHICTALFRIKL